jgi:hypothetical protein
MKKQKKPFVVIRTYSAGVHVGTLESREGREVVLSDARRIWRWSGANTLSEVSQKGVAEASRISEPVPTITLTEAIEVIPCSEEARSNLSRSRWAQ